MDLGSALAEFVDLLTVASQALMRIAENEKETYPNIEPYLMEVEAIATQLHRIGEELRGYAGRN